MARRVGSWHWALLATAWFYLALLSAVEWLAPAPNLPDPPIAASTGAAPPLTLEVRVLAPSPEDPRPPNELPELDGAIRYVRTAPEDRVDEAPETDVISARNTHADEVTRAENTVELTLLDGDGLGGDPVLGNGGAAGLPVAAGPDATAPDGHLHAPLPDWVEDVRASLGWGPIDRATLAPSLGHGPSSEPTPAAALDPLLDAPLSWHTATDTRGTPLGAYLETVETVLAARWASSHLPVDRVAAGISGQVVVRYRVVRSGKVVAAAVARSSGHDDLDALALAVIPTRLPRFPAALPDESIVHEITLRYRNPIVATSPP